MMQNPSSIQLKPEFRNISIRLLCIISGRLVKNMMMKATKFTNAELVILTRSRR
jgi:hypothetical protein